MVLTHPGSRRPDHPWRWYYLFDRPAPAYAPGRDALQRPGWRNVFQWFADRPRVTFMTGLVECLIGLGMIWRSSRDS